MRCFLDGVSIFKWGETLSKINCKNKMRYLDYRKFLSFMRNEFSCSSFEGVFKVDSNVSTNFTSTISNFGIDIVQVDHRIEGVEIASIASKIAEMRKRGYVLVSSNPAFIPLLGENGTMVGPSFGCSPIMNLMSSDIGYCFIDKEIEGMF